MPATELAQSLYEWARSNGVLAERTSLPTGEPLHLAEVAGGEPEDFEYAQTRLGKAQLVGVVADEEHNQVTIPTKGAVGPKVAKSLPNEMKGVAVAYVGGAGIHENPPAPVPASTMVHPPYHLHAGKIACGSSVTAAPVYGAGTMGCLVRTSDEVLCGLTNNHVTGDCNHTSLGMHILSPAPIDANPNGPAPMGIGRHHILVPLGSGDPQQIPLQELDVALFSISDPAFVTSVQGAGLFDTPGAVTAPTARTLVKKVGRTTGLTRGVILGPLVTPLWIPYKSERFRSVVHFTGVWAVQGLDGEVFSAPGDSGSLVVTDDDKYAVGLHFAGGEEVSLMIPLTSVVNHLGLTLVNGHNV